MQELVTLHVYISSTRADKVTFALPLRKVSRLWAGLYIFKVGFSTKSTEFKTNIFRFPCLCSA